MGPVRDLTRLGLASPGCSSGTAVEVELDGRRVSLSPNILTLNQAGDGALSSMTKAEIRAASA